MDTVRSVRICNSHRSPRQRGRMVVGVVIYELKPTTVSRQRGKQDA